MNLLGRDNAFNDKRAKVSIIGDSLTSVRLKRIFLRTDKELFSVIDQGLLSFLSFATNVLIGRSCPKVELGLYALGLSIILISIQLQTSLISTPYMIYSPRLKSYDHSEYAGSALIQQIAFSVVVLSILLLGRTALSSGVGPKGLASVFQVLVLVISFTMLKDFLRQLCFATLKTLAVLMMDLWVTIIQIGSLSLLAFLGILSARSAFIVVGISCGLPSIGWLILNRGVFVFNVKKAFPQFQSHWRFIRWLLASNLLITLGNAVFPWLIAFFCGVAANGIWVACVGVATLSNFLLVGMQNIAGPKILNAYANGGAQETRRLVLKSLFFFMLVTFIFCAFMSVLGERIVVLFYGNKYGGNGLLVTLMAFNLVVSSATFPFSRGLYAMERTDIDFKINSASILMMPMTIYLIHTLGLQGAALGLIASNSLSALLRASAFERTSRIKLTDTVGS